MNDGEREKKKNNVKLLTAKTTMKTTITMENVCYEPNTNITKAGNHPSKFASVAKLKSVRLKCAVRNDFEMRVIWLWLEGWKKKVSMKSF